MYYLGINIENSSIKVALTDANSGEKIENLQEPSNEIEGVLFQNKRIEQNAEKSWLNLCSEIKKIIKETEIDANNILGIGISYKVHGLVFVDSQGQQLKSSILPEHLPISSFKWLNENDQNLYKQIYKFLLPGDFIVFKLTNAISTTVDGLSKLGLWNYEMNELDENVLDSYQIKRSTIPKIIDNFENKMLVTQSAYKETGIPAGTPILFRAEHEASNALALTVFNFGELAITSQSPATIYAITKQPKREEVLRIKHHLKLGKPMVFSGGYLQYKWLKKQFKENSYEIMDRKASEIPIGSEGVKIFSLNNRSEQVLKSKEIKTNINGLNLNNHSKGHLYRATLESIAFSIVYKMEDINYNGFELNSINAVNDILFQSEVFVNTLTSLLGVKIEVYNTDLEVSTARICSLLDGDYKKYKAAIFKNEHVKTFFLLKSREPYIKAYHCWRKELKIILKH